MRSDDMTPDSVAQEIKQQSESEAGRALAPHGFVACDQGGGLVNFSRSTATRPGCCGDCREHIVSGVDLDGWGPLTLEETVILVHCDAEETHFGSLAEYLASLAT